MSSSLLLQATIPTLFKYNLPSFCMKYCLRMRPIFHEVPFIRRTILDPPFQVACHAILSLRPEKIRVSVSRLQVRLHDPHLTIQLVGLVCVFFHLNAPNLRQWLCFLLERLKISPDYLFLWQQTYRTVRYRYCLQIIRCVVKDSFAWYEVAIAVRILVHLSVLIPCPSLH